MPIYEYQCLKCAHEFEEIEKVSAKSKKPCPECGAQAERKLSLSSFQLKGGGWYVTDYANKGKETQPKKSGKADSKASKTPSVAATSKESTAE